MKLRPGEARAVAPGRPDAPVYRGQLSIRQTDTWGMYACLGPYSGQAKSLESVRVRRDCVQRFAESEQPASHSRHACALLILTGRRTRSPACVTTMSTTCLAIASDAVAAGDGTLQT